MLVFVVSVIVVVVIVPIKRVPRYIPFLQEQDSDWIPWSTHAKIKKRKPIL
eukprot:m.18732 g.18732  ORF g.18732 m.18732 type:complete len:51 (-) comp6393_c0_seq2:168-320(-)